MYVKEINKQMAQDFFAKYEHLGNCGLGVWHYALFNENNQLISVVSFGSTNFNTNRSFIGKIANKYGVRVIQLTRGGTKFNAPKNIPSFTIKKAMSEIKKRFGDCLIIAYSDTKWNEIGTIYQASNFVYLGTTNPKGQANYFVGNKIISGWDIRKQYGTRKMSVLENKIKDIKKIPLTPKHLYLYINSCKKLKNKIAVELSSKIQEYPKRKDLNVGSMRSIHNDMAKKL